MEQQKRVVNYRGELLQLHFLAAQLRRKQKSYFRTRSGLILKECKALESRLDKQIKSLVEKGICPAYMEEKFHQPELELTGL